MDSLGLANYIGRGETYLETREYERAVADFTTAIEQSKEGSFDFRNAVRLRGLAHLRSDHKEDALRDYDLLRTSEPLGSVDVPTEVVTAEMIRAGILLLCGRRAEYREACKTMVKRFSGVSPNSGVHDCPRRRLCPVP